MNYLLAGNDFLVLKKKLSSIVKDEIGEINAFNYVKVDGREVPLADIIQDAMLLPLGCEKKLIVVDFATFFEKDGAKSINKVDDEDLLNFLKSDNDESVLVFLVRSNNVNEKSEAYKLILEKGKVILHKDISEKDWPIFVKRYFAKFNVKIDNDAVEELVNRTSQDSLTFTNEAEKLMLLTDHITKDDVIALVSEPLEEKPYMLTNALIRNNKPLALKLFRDFMTQNVEPLIFVMLLANQFRLYSEIFILDDKGLSTKEIGNILKISDKRVYYSLKVRKQFSLDDVLKTLNTLSELDYKIKSGQIDGAFGLEMFLINF